MPTERSDKVYASWRESNEKFDYFILGIICALCAFIGQGYKPSRLGLNPGTLELAALLLLVLAAVAGFKRIEKTLLMILINQRQLHANEARGGMVEKLPSGQTVINVATGQTYTPEQTARRIAELTKTIGQLEHQLESTKRSTTVYYQFRNGLMLTGFLMLIGSRIWSAYA